MARHRRFDRANASLALPIYAKRLQIDITRCTLVPMRALLRVDSSPALSRPNSLSTYMNNRVYNVYLRSAMILCLFASDSGIARYIRLVRVK